MPKAVAALPKRLRICGLDVRVLRPVAEEHRWVVVDLEDPLTIRVHKAADRLYAHTLLLQGVLWAICTIGNSHEETRDHLNEAGVILRPVFGRWRPDGSGRLPKNVDAIGAEYAVRVLPVEDGAGELGFHDHSYAQIVIRSAPEPTQNESTLVHELIHMALYAAGMNAQHESDVMFLGVALTAAPRDNPRWEIPR